MKPHVLVVDDSLTVRMDLRGALGAAGFTVTTCETMRAGQKALAERRFDLALLDVILPDGDGIELLREIRAKPELNAMPVIVLSTEAEVKSRIRGITSGADEYIGKPYDIAYVIRRARSLCERAQSTMPPCPSGCRKILAVDDSPTFLAMIASTLREDGHDVVLARSGFEALEMLAVQSVDCVVLDLTMPDLDGIETLRRIRRMPGRDTIPTAILTGSEGAREQREAVAAGSDDYMRKTMPPDQIRARIRALLRKKQEPQPPRSERAGAPKTGERRPDSMRAPPVHEGSLFARAAAATGLTGMLARDMLARALRRAGIEPTTMSASDLLRAMPTIRESLAMFYPDDEVARRAAAMAALANVEARPGA
ncbi:response regulator transcription factor [Polyangium aurulentum]|uniref:response regulator transcription factor n=1 Tax=Polyangium aurulentum TaxID=2567896 RepID=UPI0010AEE95A|nr:response regulator [Polyangium aurulentum]UQA60740.1 response regulator [Polyangium aurulentum]